MQEAARKVATYELRSLFVLGLLISLMILSIELLSDLHFPLKSHHVHFPILETAWNVTLIKKNAKGTGNFCFYISESLENCEKSILEWHDTKYKTTQRKNQTQMEHS